MNEKLFSLTSGYFSVASGVAVLRQEFVAREPVDDLKEISAARIDQELTLRHEVSHYRQLMTTPFGLLLWRTYNSILSHAEYIARALLDIEPPVDFSVPVHKWVMQHPVSQLAQAGHRFSAHRSTGSPLGLMQIAPFIDRFSQDVQTLSNFLEALLEGKCATVGEFVTLANDAFDALSVPSDMRAFKPWRTRLAPETPFKRDFSCSEIIEACARFEERRVLELLPDGVDRIEAWEARNIHGVYAPAYRYLQERLGDTDAALAIIDVAFMSPIDLAFSGMTKHELYVEDVLPHFRLPRLAEAATQIFWPEADEDLHAFLGTTLARQAGLLPPSDVARHGAEVAYHGPTSWGSDHRLAGRDDETNPEHIFRFAENDFRRAMRWRAEDLTRVLHQRDIGDPYVFRPLITFYSNLVVFGFTEDHYRELGMKGEIALLAYNKFVRDGLALSLISTNNERELAELAQIIKRRAFESSHDADDWFHGMFSRLAANLPQSALASFFDIAPAARHLLGPLSILNAQAARE